MKKNLLSLKNVLIVVAFAIFLVFFVFNLDWFWMAFKFVLGILTPFFIGFLIAYILNFPYKFLREKA